MAGHIYTAYNAAMATTAAEASVATGTTIKTMLQIATPATRQMWVLAWGYSIDDAPGADSIIELIQTDVAATVTAHAASGVQPADASLPASLMTLGTSATGFTASAEGSIAATRIFDEVSMSTTSAEAAPFMKYVKEWTYDNPCIPVSKFLRIRATTPTSGVDMRCWIRWLE